DDSGVRAVRLVGLRRDGGYAHLLIATLASGSWPEPGSGPQRMDRPARHRARRKGGPQVPEVTPAAPSILVVDDDAKIVTLVHAYLKRAGYEVRTAHDGLSALRCIREQSPDLVVLDVMLPELDGLAVAAIVRDECEVPILMLTARGAVADRVRGL